MDRQPTHEELTQRIKILEKEAQKDKQRAGVLEEERWKLSNLVKELNCLFGLSELVARQGNSVEEILQGVVDLLPSGCQFPDICHARIVFDGRPYTSKGFAEGNWKQIADIVAHGKMVVAHCDC
jgi:hypothetical protein